MRWAADAPPWGARAEAVVALGQGFFREAGIDQAEVLAIPGEHAALDALLSGEVDFVSGLSRKVFIAQAQGAPLRIVGMSKNRLRAGLALDPGLGGDALKLKGKTVAVGIFGAVVERLSRMSVEILGLRQEDVSYVEVGTGSKRIQAVLDGQVQAAIMMNSHVEAARLAGLDMRETISDLYPRYAFHVISATAETLERRPELVAAMLEGCLRGHRLLLDESRVDEVAQHFAAQMPGGGRHEWELERQDLIKSCTHDLELDDQAFESAVDFEQQWGLLPPDYDYRPAIAPQPLAEARARIDARG